MLEHTSIIYEQIARSQYVVIVLVVADGCDKHIPKMQHELYNVIAEIKPPINAHTLCFHDEDMPFPEPATNVLYYFAPNTRTPLFSRRGEGVVDMLEADIDLAYRMIYGKSFSELIEEQYEELNEKTEDLFTKEEKVQHEFPPILQMARNAAKEMWTSAKRATQKLPVVVEAEVAASRLEICQGCEFFTEDSRCTECGCYMTVKANLAGASCPKDKWGSV